MIYTPLRNRTLLVSEEGYELLRDIHSLDDKRYAIIAVLFLVMAFPIVSNGIVLVTYAKFRCLRSSHDKLIINLSVLNILIVLSVPFYASSLIFPEYVLTDKYLCLLNFSVFRGGILSSLLILLGLALERFFCILYPRMYRRFKSRSVIIWSILSYVTGYMYFMIPVIGWNDWSEHGVCSRHVFPDAFRIGSEILMFCLLIANSVIHLCVLRIAYTHSKRIEILIKSVQRRHRTGSKRRMNQKAFVTVFILAFASTFCWLPQLIVFCIVTQKDMNVLARQALIEGSYIPILLNSGFSPIIFGYRNRHFRSAIKSATRKYKHNCSISQV